VVLIYVVFRCRSFVFAGAVAGGRQ
jgi:hypothetical protein